MLGTCTTCHGPQPTTQQIHTAMAQLSGLPREVHGFIIREVLGADILVVHLTVFESLADTARPWQRLTWKVYRECYHLEAKKLYPTVRKQKWVQWCKKTRVPAPNTPLTAVQANDIDDACEDKKEAGIASWIEML